MELCEDKTPAVVISILTFLFSVALKIDSFLLHGRHVHAEKEVAYHGLDKKPWKRNHGVCFCCHFKKCRHDWLAQAFASPWQSRLLLPKASGGYFY